MNIVHIDKFRYEIQEQKEVLLCYTDIYGLISSTDNTFKINRYLVSFNILVYKKTKYIKIISIFLISIYL
jgi:hypothetical protein